MPPLVSVIVPNYNHAPFLKQRLDSVFNQTFLDFEVILLDDKSTDSSVQILAQYAGRPQVSNFIVNEQNSGSPFAQWQKGMALARGEYIWIAESDDVAELTFLETMIGFLNEKVGIVFCKPTKIDSDGKIEKKLTEINQQPPIKDEFKLAIEFEKPGLEKIADGFLYKNLILNASTCIFKKSLAQPFPAEILNFKFTGDWYFWINVVQKTRIHFHAISLSYFRAHANTSRSAKSRGLELMRLKEFAACIRKAKSVLVEANVKIKINYSRYISIFKLLDEKKCVLGYYYYIPPLPINIVCHFYINKFISKIKLIKQDSSQ